MPRQLWPNFLLHWFPGNLPLLPELPHHRKEQGLPRCFFKRKIKVRIQHLRQHGGILSPIGAHGSNPLSNGVNAGPPLPSFVSPWSWDCFRERLWPREPWDGREDPSNRPLDRGHRRLRGCTRLPRAAIRRPSAVITVPPCTGLP